MYNIERLVDLKLECGESPIYKADENAVFFIDNGSTGIYRYDLSQKICSTFLKRSITTSLVFHESDGFVYGSTKGLHYYNLKSGENKIIDSGGVNTINLNDAIVDPAGRIFIGQESYSDNTPEKFGALFKISRNGRIEIVEEGLSISNGMAFSPDQCVFYLIDTIPRRIYAYDYEIRSGSIKNRRIIKEFDRNDGLPDGMTVDSEGFLWVALWFGSSIVRLDPEGTIVDKIMLPFSQPTSLTFGRKDRSKVFVTSAATLWKTELAPDNHDYRKTRGGSLYGFDTDIQGLPEHVSTIAID